MKQVFVLVCCMISTLLLAQSTIEIKGKVRVKETGDSIAFAEVLLKKKDSLLAGAYSNEFGDFKLLVSGLELSDTLEIKAKFFGYTNVALSGSLATLSSAPIVLNLSMSNETLSSIEVVRYDVASIDKDGGATRGSLKKMRRRDQSQIASSVGGVVGGSPNGTTTYDKIYENKFVRVKKEPLSTFSIDVDVASYADTRGYLNRSQLPPSDAVRTEEFINYFTYDLPKPTEGQPIGISTEIDSCPWNKENYLLKVAMKGVEIPMEDTPPNNLVFLIDVSGSMMGEQKLGLLKKSFKLLVNQMRDEDYVSIVVYAGAAGTVLKPTSGKNKEKILMALESLSAGGSTAGAEGIEQAYALAHKNFKRNGNNRVILATDGDFNVGISSDDALIELIESKRDEGIFLTVLGFGYNNYQSSKMEKLADKGNGNFAYIDNILEAKKVLVDEMGSTLYTIAKDVKLQLEFNPDYISEYRLIGYENRLLESEDFNDDKKDAGELGSGHTIIALYELVPKGKTSGKVDELRYQNEEDTEEKSGLHSQELLYVKVRYKLPEGKESKLMTHPVLKSHIGEVSNDFFFAASVAGFSMLLRNSDYIGTLTWEEVLSLGNRGLAYDPGGYRSSYLQLVEQAKLLAM